MTLFSLYLLPVVAILIVLQGSLVFSKSNLVYRSRRYQQRVRTRILFFRCLVGALLLATVVTKVLPLADLQPLPQGLLITLAIMLPASLYLLVSHRHAMRLINGKPNLDNPVDLRPAEGNSGAKANTVTESTQTITPAKAATRQTAKFAPATPEPVPAPTLVPEPAPLAAAPASAAPVSDTIDRNDQPSHDRLVDQGDYRTGNTANQASRQSIHSREIDDLEESALDQTLSVSEQLESLDNLVNFHDIGDEDYSSTKDNTNSMPSADYINPLEKAIAIAREGILEEHSAQNYSKEKLPTRSSTELAEMVVTLRSDKMKLQKLVIAQKAVIDAEKQAHNRTRVVVKDAISVMRHARHGQRIAEKIARRERAERQRVEKDMDKLQRQMNNAMSTLVTKSPTEPEGA